MDGWMDGWRRDEERRTEHAPPMSAAARQLVGRVRASADRALISNNGGRSWEDTRCTHDTIRRCTAVDLFQGDGAALARTQAECSAVPQASSYISAPATWTVEIWSA